MNQKVALVTGASRGIGKAVALKLAEDGFDVVVNYAGNKERAEEVVSEIENIGKKAIAIKADVTDANEVEEMVKRTIDTFGRIDVLVNNAGITRDNLMMRMKEAEWDEVMDTNLKGVFLCSQKTIRAMMKQRYGKIINISSVVGRSGNPGQANYASAKAGVIGLTKTMAQEFASRNITVNAVAPGFIQTDMTEALSDETKTELLKKIPLSVLGEAQDIAYAVSFLASEKAKYITGQTLGVDGGMYM